MHEIRIIAAALDGWQDKIPGRNVFCLLAKACPFAEFQFRTWKKGERHATRQRWPDAVLFKSQIPAGYTAPESAGG
jgi:hypothetical protein